MLSRQVLQRVSELNRQTESEGSHARNEQIERLRAQLASRRNAASASSGGPKRDSAARAARGANNIGDFAATRGTRPQGLTRVACDGSPTGQPSAERDVEAIRSTAVSRVKQSVSASEREPPTRTSDLPPGRVLETPHGAHYIVERPLNELWAGAERWLQRAATCAAPQAPKNKRELPSYTVLCRLRESLADSTMFLDLETCGFSGSMVFLAGVLVAGPKEMTLLQLLARNYAEERAMLHTLWQVASQQTLLATFNGKSFDWPVVRDRTILHRLEMRGPLASDSAPHCDLLHLSRRRWKRELPNCKLQTLERYVCGRRRAGDIAGKDIPDAYHAYVRTQDAWEMRSVLHHNALDLVTLLQLSLAMLCDAGDPS